MAGGGHLVPGHDRHSAASIGHSYLSGYRHQELDFAGLLRSADTVFCLDSHHDMVECLGQKQSDGRVAVTRAGMNYCSVPYIHGMLRALSVERAFHRRTAIGRVDVFRCGLP